MVYFRHALFSLLILFIPGSARADDPGRAGPPSTGTVPAKMQDLPVEEVEESVKDKITSEDYKRHIAGLEEKLRDRDFHIVLQRPFVVIGDKAQSWVKWRAAKTVKWSVDHLKKLYFEKDPDRILDIWLFKNKESYLKHALEFFGDRPDTPYGYYSGRNNALVMNIELGEGTLVHEIVHPFIDANFPECPAWFNEGLASLYEQSCERDGRIVGLTNWRLGGLQKAIREEKVPSFETLSSTTTRAFYEEELGIHYSQARYLCYYLQENGLLIKYYQAFLRSVKKDPTGFETLKKVLRENDMEAFKKKWEAYVLALKEGSR